MSTRDRQLAKSLKEGDTPVARKVHAEVKLAVAPPAVGDATAGIATGGAQWLHIEHWLPDADTQYDWDLYVWSSAAEKWGLYPGLPTQTVLASAYVDVSKIEIAGAPRVAIAISNPGGTGTFATGADVWFSGSTF